MYPYRRRGRVIRVQLPLKCTLIGGGAESKGYDYPPKCTLLGAGTWFMHFLRMMLVMGTSFKSFNPSVSELAS
jgi:hypothetical protein